MYRYVCIVMVVVMVVMVVDEGALHLAPPCLWEEKGDLVIIGCFVCWFPSMILWALCVLALMCAPGYRDPPRLCSGLLVELSPRTGGHDFVGCGPVARHGEGFVWAPGIHADAVAAGPKGCQVPGEICCGAAVPVHGLCALAMHEPRVSSLADGGVALEGESPAAYFDVGVHLVAVCTVARDAARWAS